MTLSIETCAVTVTGNSATTVFDYGFPIPVGASYSLIWTFTDTGAQFVLDPSLYTVSDIGDPTGGTFTYPLSGDPIDATQTLTLVRAVAYQQTTNFGNQSGYYPEVVDNTLDGLVMQIQQLKNLLNASIQQPQGDTLAFTTLPAAPLRANKLLGFDADGQLTLIDQ